MPAIHRRRFLRVGAGLALGAAGIGGLESIEARSTIVQECSVQPPAYSIIPVVGDGKWVWTAPPKDQKGYLEPRQFELKVGIELTGRGNATDIKATTVAPLELPEQKVRRVSVVTEGCAAEVRQLSPEAGQLFLTTPAMVERQVVTAEARYELTLYKQYQAYEKVQFPAAQKFAKNFKQTYMYDSPGIQTRAKEVRDLAAKIGGQASHPWDKAHAFYQWVWEHIKPRIGTYTSVLAALRDRLGDCEERAAVFVALCRAAEIPARLVWVPNHNWAEFCLHDAQNEVHWIPAHTAAYSWFGWTGAHELVLQKGDSIYMPEKSKPYRLLEDWIQYAGLRPKARYYADLKPLPTESSDDPGPGARKKDEKLLGQHERDGWVYVGEDGHQKHVRK